MSILVNRNTKVITQGLAFAALLLAAMPAAAQFRVAPPRDIADAVKSCVAATKAQGIDLDRLHADGWRAGSMVGPDKKAVETPLQFLSRGGSNAMILLSGSEAGKPCIVMSRIKSVSDAPSITRAVGQALGGEQLRSQSQSEVIWRVGSVLVLVQASGSQDQPGLRLSTIFVAPEKK